MEGRRAECAERLAPLDPASPPGPLHAPLSYMYLGETSTLRLPPELFRPGHATISSAPFVHAPLSYMYLGETLTAGLPPSWASTQYREAGRSGRQLMWRGPVLTESFTIVISSLRGM